MFVLFCDFICIVLIKISQMFVHKGPSDDKSALGEVKTWSWTRAKSLLDPMMTNSYDATWRHPVQTN